MCHETNIKNASLYIRVISSHKNADEQMMVDVSSGDLTIQTHTHLCLEVYSQICVKQNGKQVSQSKIQNLRICISYIQKSPDRVHTQFTIYH
jgi:hypothetical protein